jgi:hypothetical protein
MRDNAHKVDPLRRSRGYSKTTLSTLANRRRSPRRVASSFYPLEGNQSCSSAFPHFSHKGVVQLSGFVDSVASQAKAVEIARAVTGVTSVKNDMRLR